MMNVAVDLYNNKNNVAEGSHGSSLEYPNGAFLRSLKIKACEYMAGLYYILNFWLAALCFWLWGLRN